MSTAIITLTEKGLKTALRIEKGLEVAPFVYVFREGVKTGSLSENDAPACNLTFFSEPLSQLIKQVFKQFDNLIFVMAVGIVVRVIAPYIKDKYSDPAVIVTDDAGRFVISLLSGHEGGANALACRVAAVLHTDAVITTGTEAQKDIIVGIGCKKGVTSGAVKNAINDALGRIGLRTEQVRLISTIDVKSQEPGLLQAVRELDIPLRVVATPEIAACVKEHSKSDFVKEKIGVWGVCEPAALIAGRKTQLILTKQKYPGVTIAIARENFMW
ncbi:MAG: cobalt-precorrin 5A hydrolase [Candidatus Loosdrechtia sp.]|uniref:cobalt-precorrin 5A hydrolase n=1 Tax=Candidatus Loosdrechtia sp. TaxID=3101272 RepID=UPI003A6B54C2|nr:MAG: cobalamin biosynthesis protein [Candidatus Jettenia sp. AMX2]